MFLRRVITTSILLVVSHSLASCSSANSSHANNASQPERSTTSSASAGMRVASAEASPHHLAAQQGAATNPQSHHQQDAQLNHHSIIRVHDCVLLATIHTGNWNIECMRTGSTDEQSWEKTRWEATPMTKLGAPKDLWPVCSWLNGFGYEQLITTPDLGLNRKFGAISRRKNIFMVHHGYEVSGGMTLIHQLGRYCPSYGKNVRPAPKKDSNLLGYLF